MQAANPPAQFFRARIARTAERGTKPQLGREHVRFGRQTVFGACRTGPPVGAPPAGTWNSGCATQPVDSVCTRYVHPVSTLLCEIHVSTVPAGLCWAFFRRSARATLPTMFAALRFFASVLALFVGWGAGVMALLGVIWGGWLFLSGLTFLVGRVPVPPPFVPLAVLSLAIPVALLGVILVLYACLPARMVMYLFVARGSVRRIPADSPVSVQLRALAERARMSPPALYMYASDKLNAWALSTLFGAVVAVSSGLINTLTPDQRRWVLAHELGHIKRFDSGSAAFWAAANRTVHFGWSIHHWLVHGAANVLNALRLPFVLWATLCAPLFLLSYTLIAADLVARGFFRAFDRFIGRAMEYRADRIAGELAGAAHGVAALSKLRSGIEPSFGLFATHPATQKRVRRLQRQADASPPPAPSSTTLPAGAARAERRSGITTQPSAPSSGEGSARGNGAGSTAGPLPPGSPS